MNQQEADSDNRKKSQSMISFHFVVLSFKVDPRHAFNSTMRESGNGYTGVGAGLFDCCPLSGLWRQLIMRVILFLSRVAS